MQLLRKLFLGRKCHYRKARGWKCKIHFSFLKTDGNEVGLLLGPTPSNSRSLKNLTLVSIVILLVGVESCGWRRSEKERKRWEVGKDQKEGLWWGIAGEGESWAHGGVDCIQVSAFNLFNFFVFFFLGSIFIIIATNHHGHHNWPPMATMIGWQWVVPHGVSHDNLFHWLGY